MIFRTSKSKVFITNSKKFIVLKNVSKNPFENAQPHPYFDYEKKIFTKDGREEYMKEQEKLKKDIAKD